MKNEVLSSLSPLPKWHLFIFMDTTIIINLLGTLQTLHWHPKEGVIICNDNMDTRMDYMLFVPNINN